MINLFINQQAIPLKWWTFPGGERNVRIDTSYKIDIRNTAADFTAFKSVWIECYFKSSNDLIDILLLNNALRNIGAKDIGLYIPYFPFARQDRVMVDGEPFALQVAAQLLNSCKFSQINVSDPHSDVLPGLFEPGVLRVDPQWKIWNSKIGQELMVDESRAYDDMEQKYPNPCLVSPDAGALKKIYKLAKLLNLPVVEAGKQRDVATGDIIATTIDADLVKQYQTFFIVDDICDGGKSFTELAKVIRIYHPTAKLILCVTHGIFSKGIDVIYEYFDEVWCDNVMNDQITLKKVS